MAAFLQSQCICYRCGWNSLFLTIHTSHTLVCEGIQLYYIKHLWIPLNHLLDAVSLLVILSADQHASFIQGLDLPTRVNIKICCFLSCK